METSSLPPSPEPQAAPNTGPPPSGTLAEAAARCQLALPPEHIERVERYCRLLWDWNSRLNLTRHTDFDKFASRDLVDALAFSQALASGERVLDVGTGGGVPGVVLAIVRPDLRVEMCESVGKKARVVADMVSRLGLSAPVHHARAETVLAQSRFDSLVIRAVAPLKTLLEWFRPHWPNIGRLLVLKGPSWVEERGEARHYGLLRSLALRKIHEYANPSTQAISVLLSIAATDAATRKPQSPDQPQPPHGPSPRAPQPAAGTRPNKQPPRGKPPGKQPRGKQRSEQPPQRQPHGKRPPRSKPHGKRPKGHSRHGSKSHRTDRRGRQRPANP